ncbi:MAG TPA: helix-turn-helix domain-containing protein [Desulfobacterales bacterium]|jgi:excisionase family DNA binding protein|nr:helix-turn-helix domain-containing protein [Desulfobacterales bacterium]HSM89521.1 helix-turn-helix domain-containing protein [Desulfobacterales bacterium]
MATQTKPMTTSEFAKATGIPAAAISKLIRDGKLKAKKEGNAWMIPPSQLDSKSVRELGKAPRAKAYKKPSKAAASPKPPKAPASKAGAPAARKLPVAAPPPPSAPKAETEAPAASSRPEPAPEEKTYSIPEFAAMTYLTEKGVSEWLKSGRLRGVKSDAGEWRVLDSNFQAPDISRLARK